MVQEGMWMLRSAIEKSECRFLEVCLSIRAIQDARREDTVEGYLAAIAEKEKQINSSEYLILAILGII